MLNSSETVRHGARCGLGLYEVPISISPPPSPFLSCHWGTFDQLAYTLTVDVIHRYSLGGSTDVSVTAALSLDPSLDV